MKRNNRIRLGIGVSFSLFFVSCPPANAELTAGQLYEYCTSSDEMVKLGCGYFILGAVQGISLGDGMILRPDGKQFVERSRSHFCLPNEWSGPALVSVYIKWSKLDFMKYPEDTKLPAITWVGAVMHRVYPCKKVN